jgi:serine/threonine protein kinase
MSDRISEHESEIPDDPRLLQAVQEYLELLEKGRRPDQNEFLKRFPDIAEPLAQCIGGLDLVHGAAGREENADAAMAPGRGEPLPTEPLGDFRIVREIGRGGMGIVYEAVQLSLGRRVALKVLPFAATFDAKHLQRFNNEAKAAAQLHHTNIVPVFAVDVQRGVHFYAMQLIDGHSLADIVRQVRQKLGKPVDEVNKAQAASTTVRYAEAPAPPKDSTAAAGETVSEFSLTLSTDRTASRDRYFRHVARLAVQAAEALEHAHQYGIVHRDIKPANLIVESQGRLWITDFGLAQFHTGTALTQTGDLMGTLRYMSPEQASGQRVLLDHRTDIYSLGATLYELVTLEPIFPGATRQELLHQILNQEPRPPRSLEKAVPVDLETIILKAVAKNPGERYGSAKDLADDLRRYLEDKPIHAKRPGLVDRARKWARRHPSVVGAAIVLLMLCIAGLVVNNRMIAGEQAKTREALERERQRAIEADKRFRQAREVVDLLVQVCQDELAHEPTLQPTRKRLLEMALGYYQDFLEQRKGDPELRNELAAAQSGVRRILNELSWFQGAIRMVLVTEPDVQEDLLVTDKQRQQLAELSDKWSEKTLKQFGDHRRHPPKGERRDYFDLPKDADKDLAAILDEQQLKRLHEIDLQLQGPKVFFETEVVDALKLTMSQRQKIREIEGAVMASIRPGPGKDGPKNKDGPPKESREYFDAAKKRGVQQILMTLMPEQIRKWRELTGPPFEGRVRFCFPGPPPGPPPSPPPPKKGA